MSIISTLEQIENNVAELERGRIALGEEQVEYQYLIKRGTCFVPYETQTGLSFAPSKFIGYIDNKLATYSSNREGRDGRVTNKAINQVLGAKPIQNPALEQWI